MTTNQVRFVLGSPQLTDPFHPDRWDYLYSLREDGEETETELSGELGIEVDVTENIEIYGEVSFITDDGDFDYGTKVGATYRF